MRLVTFRTDAAGPDRVGRIEGASVMELRAPSMIAWLGGEGRADAGPRHDLSAVVLQAPVPVPPVYRDFLAFENHAKAALAAVTGGAVQLPAYWYELPAFYYGNTQCFVGPGAPVRRPAGVEWLDFELEVAAITDGDGELAGFTLFNDWSARDVQRREATVGLGVHKSKDFANSLGPWLVTPDELEYHDGKLRVAATVEVNGAVVVEANTLDQHFTWPQMLAHAGRDTRLPAGAVLGSGTMSGGSLVERGAIEHGNWLVPGDVVTISATELGSLTNPIV
jgi:fumarylacetoacetate (FAA) hydrolase